MAETANKPGEGSEIFLSGTPESHPVTFGAGPHFAAGAMLFEELGIPEEDCSDTPEPRNTGKGREPTIVIAKPEK